MRQSLLITSCLGMLIYASTGSCLGPLLVPISRSFQLTLAQAGWLIFLRALGFLLSSIIIGLWWQLTRARLFLVSSSLIFCLSLLTIALFPTLPVISTMLFLVGLSGGLIHTGIDSLFSEIYAEKRAAVLNLLHVFWGVGALLGPIMVGSILAFTPAWYLVYYLMGAASFLLFTLFYKQDLGQNIPTHNRVKLNKNLTGLIRSNLFWLLSLGIFFHVGAEISIGSWMPMFFARIRQISAVWASYSISTFWLMLIVGRGIYARLSSRIPLVRLLIMGASGATVFITLNFLPVNYATGLVFLGCAGLFISGLYPTILALGGYTFSRQIGAITGILATSGALGSMVFPWVIGLSSERIGLARGVFIIPLLIMGVGIIFSLFARISSKDHR